MADQTPVTGHEDGADGRGTEFMETPRRSFGRGVGDLAHDMTTLAELQARLVTIEAKEGIRKLVSPAVLLAAGTALLLGALPVIFAALAMFLIDVAEISRIPAYFLAAGAGLLLGASALAIAAIQIRQLSRVFHRSQNELSENLRWIKHVLRQSR